MRRLVLVAGAQDLARDPRAVAWYDRALQLLVLELSRVEGAVLVTAGSPGPEVHAEMIAFTFGVTAVAYLPTGKRRVNGRLAERWAQGSLSAGGAAVARRDAALVARAVEVRDNGGAVEAYSFLLPGAVARSSSLTRTRLAEAAGVPMRLRLWEPPGVALAEAAE